MNQITIGNSTLSIKEWNGQRVVTFKDIDAVHGRPQDTARRNFYKNKKHFIEGEDFYVIKPADIQMDEIRTSEINNRGTTFLTETGYLMLVKSFTDDLAWQVQRELVKNYFKVKNDLPQEKQLKLDEIPYEYHDKFLNGEPVLTTEDFVHITGLSRGYVSWYLRKPDFRKGIDYHLLNGEKLSKFKQQNPSISKCASEMYLITKSGFYKLCEAGGIKLSEPQCFIEQKNLPKAKEPKTSKNSQLLYVINQMRKSLGIQTIPLDRATADALGYRGSSITGQAIMYREKDGDLRLFMDFDSDEYEKAFMVLQNIGRVILGQFRKSKDCVPVGESERFTQESRMFAAAYLAQYVFAQTFPAPPMTGFNE